MKVLRFAQEIDHSAQRFYEEMAWRRRGESLVTLVITRTSGAISSNYREG
jgi:hypothetical protein